MRTKIIVLALALSLPLVLLGCKIFKSPTKVEVPVLGYSLCTTVEEWETPNGTLFVGPALLVPLPATYDDALASANAAAALIYSPAVLGQVTNLSGFAVCRVVDPGDLKGHVFFEDLQVNAIFTFDAGDFEETLKEQVFKAQAKALEGG